MSRCNHCRPVPEGVRQAAGLLERRWTVSILWASYEGASRFNEFKQSVGEIPPRTLALRLVELEEAGVLFEQDEDGEVEEEQIEQFREFLDQVRPEDFAAGEGP